MRILFTSDLHGRLKDIENFANILKLEKYDIGVIAGDIIDDGIPTNELDEYIASGELNADDFIEELFDADKTLEENMNEQIQKIHQKNHPWMQALYLKEREIKEILDSSGKDIFLIPGNHDQTEWNDYKRIINIHNRRVDVHNYNFVGYKWTNLHRSEEEHHDDIKELMKIVDKKTILVTHQPPLGVFGFGSKELLRLVKFKKPILHLFGHTHSNAGKKGKFINGAFPEIQYFFDIKLGLIIKSRKVVP